MVVDDGKLKPNENCGERFCIKKGSPKSELIREINIRLAGFGGNVPTDEFTDRTEKMVKQFQRDYMKVAETGKVCGNVLRAIDEFQKKYSIHFDDIKCNCGDCNGFGKEKYPDEFGDSSITEMFRKYEYPGIHRSLVWALKSVIFYTSVTEKKLGYTVKCISSGYRCHKNNKIHKRTSTNHMGKALDIHFYKNGIRKNVLIKDMEDVRENIYIKYIGAQLKWPSKNKFSIEPTRKSYLAEFIAPSWIHFDVREFEKKYLEKNYFAKSIEDVNGKSIVELAKLSNPKTCLCMSGASINSNKSEKITKSEKNNFTEEDGKEALKIIYDKYGKDMAIIIERMYRDETAHFKSKQYASCGTGGMEAHGEPPYYGWDTTYFESHPESHPMGLWEAFENKGMSGEGGNAQVKNKKKKFVILPSVIAGMEYKVFYIKKYDNNYARWHSTQASAQENYKKYLEKIRPKFVNEFSKK